MARRLRVQYPGTIYHLMAHGNDRQDIVRDDADRDRLVEHLERAAVRYSWRAFAFVITSNHLHVVLKTPEPNLARGMQASLSAYVNVWARRHRFSGHVFQGRYRTELVEAHHGWILGSLKLVDRVRAMVRDQPQPDRRREPRRVLGLSIARVSEVVCALRDRAL